MQFAGLFFAREAGGNYAERRVGAMKMDRMDIMDGWHMAYRVPCFFEFFGAYGTHATKWS